MDDLSELIAFFEARRGRLHGFRFRDFADWQSCAPSLTPNPLDQALGIGDGARTSFSLLKAYGIGEGVYQRPIVKPVVGSVVVAVDGVATGAFSVDVTTGVVTFTVAPAAGKAVTAGFAFDTPVRFDTDKLEASLDGFGAGRILHAPLVELLL
jgi:uncharacterized protein (TIGR02217 family)